MIEIVGTITRKGQITIPLQYRELLDLEEQDTVKFYMDPAFSKTSLIVEPIKPFLSYMGAFSSTKKYSKEGSRRVYEKEVLAGKI